MEMMNKKIQILILILLTLMVFFDFIGLNYGIEVFLRDLNLFFLFSSLVFYLPVLFFILGIIIFIYIGKKEKLVTRDLIWISLLVLLYGIKITANLLTLVNFKLGF